jgi:hypothetical protein
MSTWGSGAHADSFAAQTGVGACRNLRRSAAGAAAGPRRIARRAAPLGLDHVRRLPVHMESCRHSGARRSRLAPECAGWVNRRIEEREDLCASFWRRWSHADDFLRRAELRNHSARPKAVSPFSWSTSSGVAARISLPFMSPSSDRKSLVQPPASCTSTMPAAASHELMWRSQ